MAEQQTTYMDENVLIQRLIMLDYTIHGENMSAAVAGVRLLRNSTPERYEMGKPICRDDDRHL